MSNSNIAVAEVTILGTRPLFIHWFGPDAIPLEKQEKTGVAGNDPESWRKTTCVTKDGQLFVPGTYAFAVVREGAKQVKKGRGSIQPDMIATLQIADDKILINRYMPGFPNESAYDIKTAAPPERDSDLPVYLDVRMTRNPATKGANIAYRVACAPGWSCTFKIQWDTLVVSTPQMQSAIIDGGRLSGLGNGRKIGMGRFDLTSFEVV
jgi:hypothetical protein